MLIAFTFVPVSGQQIDPMICFVQLINYGIRNPAAATN